MRTATRKLGVSLLLGTLAYGAASAEAQENPYSAWGKEIFSTHCSPCHGKEGGGNGPAANSLKTAPSDLTLISKTHDGKFPRQWVKRFIDGTSPIPSHGLREMPIWGRVFAADSPWGDMGARAAISALADYLETIQKE